MGGAGYVHVCVVGHGVYYVLRACVDANKASGTALVIDECDAVYQTDSAKRAGVDAAAETDASIGAFSRATGYAHCGVAVADAYVLKFLFWLLPPEQFTKAQGVYFFCALRQVFQRSLGAGFHLRPASVLVRLSPSITA